MQTAGIKIGPRKKWSPDLGYKVFDPQSQCMKSSWKKHDCQKHQTIYHKIIT